MPALSMLYGIAFLSIRLLAPIIFVNDLLRFMQALPDLYTLAARWAGAGFRQKRSRASRSRISIFGHIPRRVFRRFDRPRPLRRTVPGCAG